MRKRKKKRKVTEGLGKWVPSKVKSFGKPHSEQARRSNRMERRRGGQGGNSCAHVRKVQHPPSDEIRGKNYQPARLEKGVTQTGQVSFLSVNRLTVRLTYTARDGVGIGPEAEKNGRKRIETGPRT